MIGSFTSLPYPAPGSTGDIAHKTWRCQFPGFGIQHGMNAGFHFLQKPPVMQNRNKIQPGLPEALPGFYLRIAIFLVSHGAMAQQPADSILQHNLPVTVVSASRTPESFLRAPVSIARLHTREVRQLGVPSFYDALEYMRGVQMLTPSLGYKVPNTRGFANTTNVRFAQLIDGCDNQAPHIGAPVANALGVSELDLEQIELTPGSAAALYGMNAVNGLLNLQTKNPFETPGVQLRQAAGANHLGNLSGVGPKWYGETAFRIARVLLPTLAFKINASWMSGYDWIADDRSDLGSKLNESVGLTGADNPAFDAVNGYGNESPNRRTLSLNGKNYVVARSGYAEREVADYHLRNLKADAGLYFRPKKMPGEWAYTFRTAWIDNIYQRSNRFRMDGYRLSQHSLRYRSNAFQGLAYLTDENTGQTFNLRSAAENIDRAFKPDNQWFGDYQDAYLSSTATGATVADAHRLARENADAGRPVPGSPLFNALLDSLAGINNWDVGAALRVRAKLVHTEGVVQFQELYKKWKDAQWKLFAGFDYRTYIIVPDGNYFINPRDAGQNLLYGKSGGFVQATKDLWDERLRLSATLRADKADYFSTRFSPRLSAVYSDEKAGNWRLSYQSGYRFPSIFEGFSNVNSGGVKRVGGLRVMSDGIFENSWLRSSIDAFVAAVNKSVNTGGLSQAQAVEQNKGLLQRNPYTYLKPEFVRSYETGYKGFFLNKKLFVDADLYYNYYRDFIAQVEANIPLTAQADSIPYYLLVRSKQQRYRLWTNAQTTVYHLGGGLSLRYLFGEHLSAQTNLTYARLERRSHNDGLEDGFNTPRWMLNGTLYGQHLWRTLSASITGRWQSRFDYVSFLVNGPVPAFWTLDAQCSYFFQKRLLSVKVGGSNVLNRGYRNLLGGPAIGGLYYVSLWWSWE